MEKKKGVLGSIGAVMIIMLVGKLISLVSNQVYLSHFGSEIEQINVYSLAVQIPNYIFQSVGTALSSVVIPIYAALVAKERRRQADDFASNIITSSSLITLILIALGMAASFIIPAFTSFEDKGFVGMAIRIMIPVMLFYCLNYIYQGILQSLGDFISPALVNLPSGILIILYIILVKIGVFANIFPTLGDQVVGLLIITAIGLLVQFLVMIPSAIKHGYRFRIRLDLKDEQLRTAGRMTVPVILGACAYQLNMFFNNMMMSNVAPKSVTLFNFVQNLIISSVMTIVLAITSVMYPKMTEMEARGDRDGFRATVSSTIGGMTLILAPITLGLAVLRTPFLSLISLHGEVTVSDIKKEATFLLMYCVCLVFLGIKEIVDRALYSMRITRISALTGVIIMVINLGLGYVLSHFTPLKEYGIPFAYSIAVIIGTVYLIIMLRSKIGSFGSGLAENLIKTLAATLIMGAAVWGCDFALSKVMVGTSLVTRTVRLAVPFLVGVVVYFVAALVLKVPAMKEFLSKYLHKGESADGQN